LGQTDLIVERRELQIKEKSGQQKQMQPKKKLPYRAGGRGEGKREMSATKNEETPKPGYTGIKEKNKRVVT